MHGYKWPINCTRTRSAVGQTGILGILRSTVRHVPNTCHVLKMRRAGQAIDARGEAGLAHAGHEGVPQPRGLFPYHR